MAAPLMPSGGRLGGGATDVLLQIGLEASQDTEFRLYAAMQAEFRLCLQGDLCSGIPYHMS
jgi:hypothetical protein